jgi:hypothetical protein
MQAEGRDFDRVFLMAGLARRVTAWAPDAVRPICKSQTGSAPAGLADNRLTRPQEMNSAAQRGLHSMGRRRRS